MAYTRRFGEAIPFIMPRTEAWRSTMAKGVKILNYPWFDIVVKGCVDSDRYVHTWRLDFVSRGTIVIVYQSVLHVTHHKVV